MCSMRSVWQLGRAGRLVGIAAVLVTAASLPPTAPRSAEADTAAAAAPTLPEQMRYIPPGQTQLITVQVAAWGRRDARLDLWSKRPDGHWLNVGTTSARLGARGMVPGQYRRQDTYTTPSGRYTVTPAFGRVSSSGYKIPYRLITSRSYWCLDNESRYYNRWVEQYPMTICRPSRSERLISYPEYRRALVIGYNLNQVRYKGGAIFLHDHGSGYTAGCVSVDRATMDKISLWLSSAGRPSIVLGTRDSILRQ
jgi:L,D-peptidoglycan transpeptidase YkuD (ErfK/YbiS/YcfS/YnhG family)